MLTATPAIVTIQNVPAGAVTIVVTTDQAGMVSGALADGTFVTLTGGPFIAPSGTMTITPVNAAGGDDVLTLTDANSTLAVPIALGASALATNPTSTNLTAALAYIRLLADAPTVPSDPNLGLLLNQALLEVGDDLDQVLSTASLSVVAGSPTVTLPADVQDIVEFGYSTNLPNVPGAIPYELVELGPGEFMDFNAGVSGAYGYTPAGPTLYYTRLSDTFGRIRLQFSPLPPAGYLNYTYHPRVSQFNLASGTSTSSLDPAYFEMAVMLTCEKVTLSQRDFTRAGAFRQRYDAMMAKKKISVGRRNNGRKSVVRDVMSEAYNALPTWFPY